MSLGISQISRDKNSATPSARYAPSAVFSSSGQNVHGLVHEFTRIGQKNFSAVYVGFGRRNVFGNIILRFCPDIAFKFFNKPVVFYGGGQIAHYLLRSPYAFRQMPQNRSGV